MRQSHIIEFEQALTLLIDEVQLLSKEDGNLSALHLEKMRDNIIIYQVTKEKDDIMLWRRLVQEWERFNHVWTGDMEEIVKHLPDTRERVLVFLHEVDRINRCLYSEEVYHAVFFNGH